MTSEKSKQEDLCHQLGLEHSIINPLMLNTVLDVMFECLDVQQLLICRLVCTTWRDNKKLRIGIKKNSVVNIKTVFLQTATAKENIGNYFFNGKTIFSCYILENISYCNKFVVNFFSAIGPTIRFIELHLSFYQLNINQFRELIYEKLPNLEKLSIYDLSHKEVLLKTLFTEKCLIHTNLKKLQFEERRSAIVKFMAQFLNSLPNLQEISLQSGICTDWNEQADIWRDYSAIATSIIKGLETSTSFQSLKVLRCGKLHNELIDILSELGRQGLQLEVLQLHVPKKIAEKAFTAFLNTQRNSLKQLIIFEQRSASSMQRKQNNGHAGFNESFVLKLPEVMPKLEIIELSKHHKSDVVPFAIDTTLCDLQCPKLKRLVFLGQCSNSELLVEKLLTQSSSNIKDITMWSRVNSENAAFALGCFKNLTKLHIRYPSSNFLSTLWKSCRKIQFLELILEEGENMDEGMTGMCQTDVLSWENQASVSNYLSKEIILQNYSIVNLQDLRMLKVIVEHDETLESQSLTDFTASFALQKMLWLKKLELYTSDWRRGLIECLFVSKECQYCLSRQLQNTVIHFTPCSPVG